MRTHLRITEGSASCASAAIGRAKPGASMRATMRGEQVDGQLEMREAVAHLAGRLPVSRASAPVRQRLFRRPRRGAPFGAGQFGHAAQQARRPDGGAAARCRPRRSARSARRGAAAVARFAALRGSSAAMPARRPAQPAIHGHSAQAGAGRRADGGAEIEQCLGEVGGPCPRPPDRDRAAPPVRAATAWPAATPPSPRTAAPRRARHCHPPAPPAHRRRSRRPPQRCIRRCPAARADPPGSRGNPPAATTARAQACRLRARA